MHGNIARSNMSDSKAKDAFIGEKKGNTYPRIKRFLSELDDGVVPINLWYYKDTATLDEGTKLVDSILGKDVFDYPKPIQIIQRMLNLMNDSNAIILDFFSGSQPLLMQSCS